MRNICKFSRSSFEPLCSSYYDWLCGLSILSACVKLRVHFPWYTDKHEYALTFCLFSRLVLCLCWRDYPCACMYCSAICCIGQGGLCTAGGTVTGMQGRCGDRQVYMQDSQSNKENTLRRVWGCWGQEREGTWDRAGGEVGMWSGSVGGGEVARGIRNEIWRADIWLNVFLEHVSTCVSSQCMCVYFKCVQADGHHLSWVDKSVERKKKGKLPSVKLFLLSAANLWACESRAYEGVA